MKILQKGALAMIKLYFTLVNGVRFYEKPSLLNELSKFEGKRLCETIEIADSSKTQDQIGYYRATNRWLIENTEAFAGYDEEDIHNLFLDMFSKTYKSVNINGLYHEIAVIIPTRDMNKKQMSDFLLRREAWLATELQISIPKYEDVILRRYRTVNKKR